MLLSKVVAGASFLIAMFKAISAMPQPGIVRERHIIHAPIRFKIIHHYNIKKVPIVVKKHLHYYKPQEDDHHHSNAVSEDNHSNEIYEDTDDTDGHYDQFNSYQQVHLPKFKIYQQEDYDDPEDDYEEQEQSQEKEYKDYEYE